ncbi:hypothetical protein COOONC_09292 [Cooperia oncophora]
MSREVFRVRLVELIESEHSLWDATCDEYHHLGRKSAAWERILHILHDEGHNTTLTEAQAAWKSIKDGRRKRKRQESATGSAALKKYKWEEMLTFLDKNDFDSTTVSNIDENGNFCYTEQQPINKPEQEESPKWIAKEEKGRKSKQEEALVMIKDAAAAVKARVERREVPIVNDSGDDRKDSKYWYFGNFISKKLEEIDPRLADQKMYQITMILFNDNVAVCEVVNDAVQTLEGTTITMLHPAPQG